MSLTEIQPINCVSCERWLDINSYPTRWNAYHNVCGQKECEEKFIHSELCEELTKWGWNGSLAAAKKTLEKVKTHKVAKDLNDERLLDLIDYGLENCRSWAFDSDERDEWAQLVPLWEALAAAVRGTPVPRVRDEDQSHPCTSPGCSNTVEFDDEPWCFTHSPDSGSDVPGWSYKALYGAKA